LTERVKSSRIVKIEGIINRKGEEMKAYVPMYSIQLVKEDGYVENPQQVHNSKDIKNVIQPMIGNSDRECMIIVSLDTKNHIIAADIVSIGTLNQSFVHPREVFKSAIIRNACSIIMCHNHPSGDVTPSEEDVKVTKNILLASKFMGIPLLDHIILSHNNKFFSFLDNGVLKSIDTKN
jgi:DNA repair protein RadC